MNFLPRLPAMLLLLVCCAAVAAETQVTVLTLEGDTLQGELQSLNVHELTVDVEGEASRVAIDQIMLLKFDDSETTAEAAKQFATLNDNSRLALESITLKDRSVTLQASHFGEQTMSVDRLRSIQFQPVDEAVSETWIELRNRNSRDDLLVFRKGDALDYVTGPVIGISDQGVTVTVQGRNLTAPAERVFGIIFARREDLKQRPIGLIRTVLGEELQVQTLSWEDGQLKVSLIGELATTLDVTRLREIDFGGGRIRFLADLPFDDSASVSPDSAFPVVWFTARNFVSGTGGRQQLRIDGQVYPRGLWLHSGAEVRFLLNRQFKELRAIAGFEQTYRENMPRFDPRVKLVIEADGEERLSQEFGWNDPAEKLNLEISDVRELIIRVESLGAGRGILEHFALGDAQLIK